MEVTNLKLGQYVKVSGIDDASNRHFNPAGYKNGDVLKVWAIGYSSSEHYPVIFFKSNREDSIKYCKSAAGSFTITESVDKKLIGAHVVVPEGCCSLSVEYATPCEKPIGIFNGDFIRRGDLDVTFAGHDKLCYLNQVDDVLLFSSAENQALLKESLNQNGHEIKIGDYVKMTGSNYANHPTETRAMKIGDTVKVSGFGASNRKPCILYQMQRKDRLSNDFSCDLDGGSRRKGFNMLYLHDIEAIKSNLEKFALDAEALGFDISPPIPKEEIEKDMRKTTEREKTFDKHIASVIETEKLIKDIPPSTDSAKYAKIDLVNLRLQGQGIEIRDYTPDQTKAINAAARKYASIHRMSVNAAKDSIKKAIEPRPGTYIPPASFSRKALGLPPEQGGVATAEKTTIETDQKLALTPKKESDSIGPTAGRFERSRQFLFPFFGSLDMKTFQKVGLGSVAALLLGFAVFGGDLFSYIGTGAGLVKEAAKDSVPIQFEIDRAKSVVAKLVPDIKTNMTAIAQEEVELAKLNEEIKTRTASLSVQKDEMLTLRNDLKSTKNVSFTYGGKTFTRGRVEADLASRLERYQVNEASLGSLNKMATIRETSLATARQKLNAMLDQKRQLEVELESLAARLKMVDLVKTTSNYNFDESSLSHAKQVVAGLKGRLEVEEKLANVEAANEVSLKEDALLHANIADRVSDYLGEEKKPTEVAVTK